MIVPESDFIAFILKMKKKRIRSEHIKASKERVVYYDTDTQ